MKNQYNPKYIFLTLIFLIAIGIFIGLYRKQCMVLNNQPQTRPEKIVKMDSEISPEYTVKKFNLDGKIQGLSNNQINQHLQLYKGYVNKRNEITDKLKTVNRKNAGSRTYSAYRALKVAETYAVNGSVLHELYFENLGKQNQKPGPLMQKLIEKSFGSMDAFKQDFMDAGSCARGWVLTGYMLDDNLIHNFVLEEHNQHVPVLCIPLLILDVYEHAYMIDFGIHRNKYLDVFWKNIDWNAVEQRIKKWVDPIEQAQ